MEFDFKFEMNKLMDVSGKNRLKSHLTSRMALIHARFLDEVSNFPCSQSADQYVGLLSSLVVSAAGKEYKADKSLVPQIIKYLQSKGKQKLIRHMLEVLVLNREWDPQPANQLIGYRNEILSLLGDTEDDFSLVQRISDAMLVRWNFRFLNTQ